ncbi:hypothetical protein [Bacteroides sp.]|uniref:hypothetical protein n=1 Tax=Bacteroides sp. TaxID=29523 RepID=UPI00260BBD76|nr:hypothetical protein [Bacteroides sp.]
MKVTVYWTTKKPDMIARIRKRFNLSDGMTVNGETTADIKEEDLPDLRLAEKLKYIQIRIKPV